jgi:hypothetical protein
MSPMPFKWKFFRFNNYFHIGLVLLLTTLLIVGWTTEGEFKQVTALVVAAVGLALLFTNSVNNLILLGKYYPENLPGIPFSRYIKTLFGFSLAPLACLGIIAGYGIYEECISAIVQKRNPDSTGLTMAGFFLLAFVTGLHACWYQVVLRKTIRRNFNLGIDRFLSDEEP